MSKLILFNKPYGVLSQFTSDGDTPTLKNYIDIPHVYPCGRLDKDSEGLLLLTDDGKLQHQISHPKKKLAKTYWVQVEGIPNNDALDLLRQAKAPTKERYQKAKVKLIKPPTIWPRVPPIRERKSLPTSWLEIIITEGKNRQVRKMTAAIGYPTLRLIRVQIGQWRLGDLALGKLTRITL